MNYVLLPSLLAILVSAWSAVVCAAPPRDMLPPAEGSAPEHNAVTAERVALGQTLFFDPRLSASGWISCASCHNPGQGWSDGLPTMLGHGMKAGERNTPTILNSAFLPLLMWDGRFRTLEEQALGPIEAAGEMNMKLDEMVARVRSIPGYAPMFADAYPGEGINSETVAKAVASYERTIVSSGTSPFDDWVRGDEKALSAGARRGYELFNGKGNCAACHSGWAFTDGGFHNIGLDAGPGGVADNGRHEVLPLASMKGAFKTPTLRDVALSAPYMRDGRYDTLREVVEHYNRGGDSKENLSPEMRPLNLSDQEIDDLVAFMGALTDRRPAKVVYPQLPAAVDAAALAEAQRRYAPRDASAGAASGDPRIGSDQRIAQGRD